MSPPDHHVKSISKAFELLEVLERSGAMGVTELSRRTGIAKSSVFKYLDTLRHLGFVTKSDQKYALSLRFYQLGQRTVNRHAVFSIARPELEALAEQTGETVALLVEEAGEAVYLYRAPARERPTDPDEVGRRIPIHECAGGKAILSYRPPEDVEASLSISDADADREQLFDELERARDQRIVIDRRANATGGYSAGLLLEGHRHTIGQRRTDADSYRVAVPIRDERDYAVAAIEVIGSAVGPNARRLEDDVVPLLVSAAKSVEIDLLKR